MAKKSKTQKAKASAKRAAKKAQQTEVVENVTATVEDEAKKSAKKKQEAPKPEKTAAQLRMERRDAKMAAKENRQKRQHGKFVQFFIDVRSEMHRVTWPESKDIRQWTGVVIGALLFFGVYVAALDNLIMTPLLTGLNSLFGLMS